MTDSSEPQTPAQPASNWLYPAATSQQRADIARVALAVTVAALGLGIAADILVRGGDIGLGNALWVLLWAAATILLGRSFGAWPASRSALWLLAPAVAFGVMLAVRDSPALAAFNILGIAACGTYLVSGTERGHALGATIVELGIGFARGAASAVFGGTRPITVLAAAREESPEGRLPIRQIAIGAGIAIIATGVFAALFASADPRFQNLLDGLFPDNVGELLTHPPLIAIFAWVIGGYLWVTLVEHTRAPDSLPDLRRLGTLEVVMVLATVTTLFVAFIALQIPYLFGDAEHLASEVGMSYAEYARRGFFELVAAAALVVTLLWGLSATRRIGDTRAERTILGLNIAMVAVTLVMMASSVKRMLLYMEEYGLTETRLYVMATLAWIAVLLLGFAATVLRGRPGAFPAVVIIGGMAIILGLNAINPDARIAQVNIERSTGERGELDTEYLAELSADAVPTIMDLFDKIPERERSRLGRNLAANDRDVRSSTDWRGRTLGNARAHAALEDAGAALGRARRELKGGGDDDVALQTFTAAWNGIGEPSSTEWVEAAIAKEDTASFPDMSVNCPETVAFRQGLEFACEVTGGRSETVTVTAYVDRGEVSVRWHVPGDGKASNEAHQ